MILVYSSAHPDSDVLKSSFSSAVKSLFEKPFTKSSIEQTILTSYHYMLYKLVQPDSEQGHLIDSLEDIIGFATINLDSNPRVQISLNLRQVPELVLFRGNIDHRIVRNERLVDSSMPEAIMYFLRETLLRQSQLVSNFGDFKRANENGEKYAFICNPQLHKLEQLKPIVLGLLDRSISPREARLDLTELKSSLSSTTRDMLRDISTIADAFKFTRTNTNFELAHLYLIQDVQLCAELGVKTNKLVSVFDRRAVTFNSQFRFAEIRNFLVADNINIPEFEGPEMLSDIVKFDKPILLYVSLADSQDDSLFQTNPHEWFNSLRSFRDFGNIIKDRLSVVNLDRFTLLKTHVEYPLEDFDGQWDHQALFRRMAARGQLDFDYYERFMVYFIEYDGEFLNRYVYTSDFSTKISAEGVQEFYQSIKANRVQRVLNAGPAAKSALEVVRNLTLEDFYDFALEERSTKFVLMYSDGSRNLQIEFANATKIFTSFAGKGNRNDDDGITKDITVRFGQLNVSKDKLGFVETVPSIVVFSHLMTQPPRVVDVSEFDEMKIVELMRSSMDLIDNFKKFQNEDFEILLNKIV